MRAVSTLAIILLFGLSPASAAEPSVSPGQHGFVTSGNQNNQHQEAGPVTTVLEPERVYSYVPVCTLRSNAICYQSAICETTGTEYTVYIVNADGTREPAGTICRGGTAPDAAPPEVTSELVLTALRRIGLPEPVLSIQPPGGKTLVNLETIFSTEAETFTRRVEILGQQVDVQATPTTFTWLHGDGTTQSSDWPGRDYVRGVAMSKYLTHTYLKADVTVQPSVAVTWSAEFRVEGGPWQGVDGTVTVEGAPASLRVVEATPLLVSTP